MLMLCELRFQLLHLGGTQDHVLRCIAPSQRKGATIHNDEVWMGHDTAIGRGALFRSTEYHLHLTGTNVAVADQISTQYFCLPSEIESTRGSGGKRGHLILVAPVNN